MEIPYTHVRGGTSKGLFFLEHDLPSDILTRDQIFREALGAPDPHGRQLNGLGSGTSSTNKIAIVSSSGEPDADIDFEFVQVDFRNGATTRYGTCGNISSGVGPYAVWSGLVRPAGDRATVRVRNTNTGKFFNCSFPLDESGQPRIGAADLAGVTGLGVPVDVSFLDPSGAISGKQFPTGAARNELSVLDGRARVVFSLIDSANPVVFLSARDLGVRLDSFSMEDNRIADVVRTVRRHCAVVLGLASSPEDADAASPFVPLVAVVDEAQSYTTSAGTLLESSDYDIRSVMISMGLVHGAHPFTGAIATALAASTPGNIVSDQIAGRVPEKLRIGHPSGVLTIGIRSSDGRLTVEGPRSARRLSRGLLSIDSIRP